MHRGLGNQLVIAMAGDTAGISYAYSQQERAEALRLLGIADAILLMEGNELELIVEDMRPKLVILGNEFKENENIRKIARLQSSRGCAIQFHAGEVQYASTQLLDSTESDLTQERRIIFEVACKRQGVNTEDMLRCIDGFCESRLIVLGDTIVDQYAACEALGMSAEAPVIVVKELEEKRFWVELVSLRVI